MQVIQWIEGAFSSSIILLGLREHWVFFSFVATLQMLPLLQAFIKSLLNLSCFSWKTLVVAMVKSIHQLQFAAIHSFPRLFVAIWSFSQHSEATLTSTALNHHNHITHRHILKHLEFILRLSSHPKPCLSSILKLYTIYLKIIPFFRYQIIGENASCCYHCDLNHLEA